MREKEKNMAKKNYYAVKQGKVPGIYRTWDACKAQVHGYPGAIYKRFERLEEAEAFLGGGKMPEPLLRETKGTYFAAPERKAVQSTAAPDPSSWDWEHLILAEKPCEDPEYAGVGRSAVAYVDGSYQHVLGTRPPTVDEWEKYELHHRARLAIKPGLTGMWQVSGRSEITDFEALNDAINVVVKIPGANNDKYIVKEIQNA